MDVQIYVCCEASSNRRFTGNFKQKSSTDESGVGQQDNDRRTAFMHAVMIHYNPRIIRTFLYFLSNYPELLEKEIGQKDNDGCTALMHAVKNNQYQQEIEVFLETLSKHPELLEKVVGQKDKNGCTALMYAVENGNVEAVRILAPYEVGICRQDGVTALDIANMCKCPDEIIQILKEAQKTQIDNITPEQM